MSAGLAWNEDIPYSNPANSERRIDAPAEVDTIRTLAFALS
jgi:hypothetical protein